MSLHVGCLLHPPRPQPHLHPEERVSSICMRSAPLTLHIIKSPLPQIPPQYIPFIPSVATRSHMDFHTEGGSAPVGMPNTDTVPTKAYTNIRPPMFSQEVGRRRGDNSAAVSAPRAKWEDAPQAALNCRKAALIGPYLPAHRHPGSPSAR